MTTSWDWIKWISVEDRLPIIGALTWVLVDGHKHQGYFHGGGYDHWIVDGLPVVVTHWCALEDG